MFKKRLFAYIIDFFVLFFILTLVGMFIPNSQNSINLNDQLSNINNSFINGDVDINTFINQYSVISYGLEKEMFISSLISIVINILYFIVYPLYNNGQSFGKKYIGINIVSNDDNDVSSNQLIIRYLFMNGIGSSIISLCLIFVLKDLSYMYAVSILSILQFLVAISSIFMVLYRNDKRSLPDLIAGTKVIEVKK